ncbi:MAG: histidinol-phosphate transaminase [Bacteroidales bacterium]|nr:histidinol-phosphate transaminase [Bacteroidales bacterium]
MKEIERLVRDNIRVLSPYSTARDELSGSPDIFLDANESPYPGGGWNRYPDPRQKELKEAIAPIKGVRAGQIFLGNGSDEAIDLIFRVFCTPGEDNIVAIAPSYGMYEVAAQINDIEVRKVLLGAEDFSLPSEGLLAACDSHTKAMFLCSPNNPTGNAFRAGEILALMGGFKGILVVDEAYIDFCSEPSLLGRLDSYPRLVVLQTFSKARGLAALRLGMAFACEEIISLMSMVKYPYNINAATQRLALEALQRPIDDEVRTIVSERERLAALLPGFDCVQKVYPSEANFLLVKVDDADKLYAHLIADGIIVRNRSRVKLCEGCLRMTVGLPSENDALLASLATYKTSE